MTVLGQENVHILGGGRNDLGVIVGVGGNF